MTVIILIRKINHSIVFLFRNYVFFSQTAFHFQWMTMISPPTKSHNFKVELSSRETHVETKKKWTFAASNQKLTIASPLYSVNNCMVTVRSCMLSFTHRFDPGSFLSMLYPRIADPPSSVGGSHFTKMKSLSLSTTCGLLGMLGASVRS